MKTTAGSPTMMTSWRPGRVVMGTGQNIKPKYCDASEPKTGVSTTTNYVPAGNSRKSIGRRVQKPEKLDQAGDGVAIATLLQPHNHVITGA